MRNKTSWNRIVPILAFGIIAMLVLAAPTVSLAADNNAAPSGDKHSKSAEAEESNQGFAKGIIALAAALSIGITAIATAIAQARIGSAGIGAIAENPKRLGAVIMLVAIPETVAILGFVIAYLILSGV